MSLLGGGILVQGNSFTDIIGCTFVDTGLIYVGVGQEPLNQTNYPTYNSRNLFPEVTPLLSALNYMQCLFMLEANLTLSSNTAAI